MVAGRVVRFDSARGYGFISPVYGGEDVFLHVNDLEIPEMLLRSGLRVEFEIEEGERGLKASSVRLPELAERKPAEKAPTGTAGPASDEEQLCDVLSQDEFNKEMTELLLAAAPSLTGEQIVEIRRRVTDFGKLRGWVEE
ncbi:cold-shock protein [Streptomyces tendae]|uniref:cold-shock protein n=1 Tax=Streptomyces tendae TaxID=1932 RepID=UPI00379D9A09